MSDNEYVIQTAYRWGNSAYTPWVDVADNAETEVHAGFFVKARIKPSRCAARWELGGDQIMQCERPAHDGPSDDPIHEGAVPDSSMIVRWTGNVPRMFPTYDGRLPEGN